MPKVIQVIVEEGMRSGPGDAAPRNVTRIFSFNGDLLTEIDPLRLEAWREYCEKHSETPPDDPV